MLPPRALVGARAVLCRPRPASLLLPLPVPLRAASGAASSNVLPPASYKRLREADMAGLGQAGLRPYGPCFKPTKSVTSFARAYECLEPGEKRRDTVERLVGRLGSRREHGNKIAFVDLEVGWEGEGEGHTHARVQLMLLKKELVEVAGKCGFEMAGLMRKGDVVGVEGFPGKTNKGEVSLVCTSVQLLAPCLFQLPSSITHHDTRYRQRHLDLLISEQSRRVFVQRARLIQALRRFLDTRGFLEVETATLAASGGGATARPFLTHSHGLSERLQLRIAPELSLKTLVVGGLDRVYEIGKQFRNEAVDATHNPEFTTCEFYTAHHNADDLMDFTEQLMAELVRAVSPESLTVPALHGDPLCFDAPFRRIDFKDEIERCLQCTLPNVNDEDSAPKLVELFRQHSIDLPPVPHSLPRLLDALASHVIEPQCHQPTFVINHPLSMSPLARENPNKPGFAHRFELFINGFEVVNAYSELNDPNDQRERFKHQWDMKDEGEKLLGRAADDHFCDVLEYGMPPTAGWGMGIDRVCMLLTNSPSIKDVLLFPMLRTRQLADKAAEKGEKAVEKEGGSGAERAKR